MDWLDDGDGKVFAHARPCRLVPEYRVVRQRFGPEQGSQQPERQGQDDEAFEDDLGYPVDPDGSVPHALDELWPDPGPEREELAGEAEDGGDGPSERAAG